MYVIKEVMQVDGAQMPLSLAATNGKLEELVQVLMVSARIGISRALAQTRMGGTDMEIRYITQLRQSA